MAGRTSLTARENKSQLTRGYGPDLCKAVLGVDLGRRGRVRPDSPVVVLNGRWGGNSRCRTLHNVAGIVAAVSVRRGLARSQVGEQVTPERVRLGGGGQKSGEGCGEGIKVSWGQRTERSRRPRNNLEAECDLAGGVVHGAGGVDTQPEVSNDRATGVFADAGEAGLFEAVGRGGAERVGQELNECAQLGLAFGPWGDCLVRLGERRAGRTTGGEWGSPRWSGLRRRACRGRISG
jgi:hypothetical protein